MLTLAHAHTKYFRLVFTISISLSLRLDMNCVYSQNPLIKQSLGKKNTLPSKGVVREIFLSLVPNSSVTNSK